MTTRSDEVAERLPGPLGSAWVLSARTARSSIDDRVHGLAAEAAFFSLLSIPPLILAVVGSIGFVADILGARIREDVEALVFSAPAAVFTPEAMELIRPVLEEVLHEGRGDVVSIGFLIALWAGSRAVNVFLEATNFAYHVESGRSLIRRRALAYGMTLGGSVLVILLVPALVLGPDLVGWLLEPLPGAFDDAAVLAAERAFWPVVVIVTLLALTAFYDIAVPWQTPLRRDVPGALLALLVLVLGSGALRIYAAYAVAGEGGVYGSLATPLVLILYVYVAAFAVLLGAELNAAVERLWPYQDDELMAEEWPPDDADEEWPPHDPDGEWPPPDEEARTQPLDAGEESAPPPPQAPAG